MAGTLFGLPLSQQLDADGDPHSGALLYVYAALTSTPSDTFADSGLTTLNAFPMEADASGRIPQFWVDDGSYRARLTTAGGVEIFDEDNILAIGPSVASSGGGGGGGSVSDTTAVFSAGDMKWKPVSGTETGWVRANGRTIGSASSGGTERASSDTQTLYEFLWNNFTNALCPVTTGRGGSALADFASNKSIGTLDMRGYGAFGLDDMGNSAVGRLVTGTPTSAGSATGAEKTTISQANLPNVNLSSASLSLNNATTVVRTSSTVDDVENTTGTADVVPRNVSINTISISGTVPLGGSGTAATTISPGRLGTWYLKL